MPNNFLLSIFLNLSFPFLGFDLFILFIAFKGLRTFLGLNFSGLLTWVCSDLLVC